MSRRGPVGLIVAWALFASACEEVTSPQPVGETVAELDAKDWTGTWVDSDGNAVFIQDVDAGTGHLRLVWFEDDGGTLERRQMDVVVRTSNGGWLGSVAFVPEDGGPAGPYWWGRVQMEGDILLVWAPDARKFGGLVQRGLLPGEVESDDVVRLGTLEPRHLELVTSEEYGVLFCWAQPMVAHRVAN